jgi:hypothetical protein
VDPQKTRDITEGDSFDVEYSYSVKWRPVATRFGDRMDRYSRYSFLPQHLEVRLCVGAAGPSKLAAAAASAGARPDELPRVPP